MQIQKDFIVVFFKDFDKNARNWYKTHLKEPEDDSFVYDDFFKLSA